jgi:putative flippase GtrA
MFTPFTNFIKNALNILKNKNFIYKFIKFSIVGMLNTLISYSSLLMSINAFHLNLLVANLIGLIIGILISFTLNLKFTFRSKFNLIFLFKYIFIVSIAFSTSYFIQKSILLPIFLGFTTSKVLALDMTSLFGIPVYIAINFIGNYVFNFNNIK